MAVCGFLVTALLWLGLCSVNRAAMGKEHKENERAIRKSRQELSEQSAVSMNSLILTYKTCLGYDFSYCHSFASSDVK